MKFFDHKDLGNHPLQLCPKVMKHPVYIFNSSVYMAVTLLQGGYVAGTLLVGLFVQLPPTRRRI